MYTLRKCIQSLAIEADVREECGPYVTKPGTAILHPFKFSVNSQPLGCQIPDWPKLLHLYSRLKPGKTVLEWMETYGIHELGIDVRRFTSFGVIKVSICLRQSAPFLIKPAGLPPARSPMACPTSFRIRLSTFRSIGSSLYFEPQTNEQSFRVHTIWWLCLFTYRTTNGSLPSKPPTG